MTATTLDQVQQLADQLTPLDQARLIEHLTERIVELLTAQEPEEPTETLTSDPWEHFFETLDAIAPGPWVSGRTATEELMAMRR
jgi:hypothetical protein